MNIKNVLSEFSASLLSFFIGALSIVFIQAASAQTTIYPATPPAPITAVNFVSGESLDSGFVNQGNYTSSAVNISVSTSVAGEWFSGTPRVGVKSCDEMTGASRGVVEADALTEFDLMYLQADLSSANRLLCIKFIPTDTDANSIVGYQLAEIINIPTATITSLVEDEIVSLATVTVSGEAGADQSVEVSVDRSVVGTTTANSSGEYSMDVTLAPGRRTVEVANTEGGEATAISIYYLNSSSFNFDGIYIDDSVSPPNPVLNFSGVVEGLSDYPTSLYFQATYTEDSGQEGTVNIPIASTESGSDNWEVARGIGLPYVSSRVYSIAIVAPSPPAPSRVDLHTTELNLITEAPIIEEITGVPSSSANTTPDYTFFSTQDGTITYGGSCSSATTSATQGSNTVTFNALSPNAYNDCTISITNSSSTASNTISLSSFTITGEGGSGGAGGSGGTTEPTTPTPTPSQGPLLSVITLVPASTTDATPDYTFASDQAGTITYGGSCSSSTTNAVVGNNTVTFNTLLPGTYNDCTITVTNSENVASSLLGVNEFTVIPDPGLSLTEFNFNGLSAPSGSRQVRYLEFSGIVAGLSDNVGNVNLESVL